VPANRRPSGAASPDSRGGWGRLDSNQGPTDYENAAGRIARTKSALFAGCSPIRTRTDQGRLGAIWANKGTRSGLVPFPAALTGKGDSRYARTLPRRPAVDGVRGRTALGHRSRIRAPSPIESRGGWYTATLWR